MQVTKPAYVRKADRPAPVRCPACGLIRFVSDRRARAMRSEGRVTLCQSCRYPSQIRDQDRLFWLRNHSDEEIADLAVALFGVGDAEAVASWRAKLIPARRVRRRRRSKRPGLHASLWDRLDASLPPGPAPQVGEVRFAEWVEAEAAVGLLDDTEALAALAEHERVLACKP